jgi:2-aminoadipate transaminase
MVFDIAASFRSGLPAPAARWDGNLPYSFVGGHNDAASVPFAGLAEAATTIMRREGPALAAYNLGGSPQGYLALREFVAGALGQRASMPTDPEQVLVTSGSLQALDLVNDVFLEPGDTVVVEEATYGGTLSRLATAGAQVVGVGLDQDGMRTDHLAEVLSDLAAQGRRPKFIYTIPTVQNPTGSVMTVQRRLELLELARQYEVPIFEDDCYADLVFDGERPPTIRALDDGGGQVVYCGSFSKSIAPSLRVGYVVADWEVMGRLLALKTDAGSGALEQLVVAEYAATHFDAHVAELTATLAGKCAAMCEALGDRFGDLVQFVEPRGGIFVWVTFPDSVDTETLVAPALDRGVEFNAGAGWSVDPVYGARRMRLCFGHPSVETIAEGVGVLAEVVAAETGLALP